MLLRGLFRNIVTKWVSDVHDCSPDINSLSFNTWPNQQRKQDIIQMNTGPPDTPKKKDKALAHAPVVAVPTLFQQQLLCIIFTCFRETSVYSSSHLLITGRKKKNSGSKFSCSIRSCVAGLNFSTPIHMSTGPQWQVCPIGWAALCSAYQ